MKQIRLFLALVLSLSTLGAWAATDVLPCSGITPRTGNNNVKYGNVFSWSAGSANTMRVFSFEAGTLSEYATFKIQPTMFIDRRADQSSAWTEAKFRVLFLSGSTSVKEWKLYTIDNSVKSLDLSTSGMTAEQIASITEIAIGGYTAAASVVLDMNAIKLVKANSEELVCQDITTRGGNNNCKLEKNCLIWNASSSNTMSLYTMEAGALSKYEHMKIKLSNFTDLCNVGSGNKVRILFIAGTTTVKTQSFATINGGEKDINLAELMTAEQIASITEIAIGGNCNAGSVIVKPAEIYLETYPLEEMTFTTTINNQSTVSTPFGWYKLNEGGELEKRAADVTNSLGTTSPANSIIFGYNSNTYSESTTGYMDLTGYSKVTVELNAFDNTKNTQVRLLNAEDGGAIQTISGFANDKLSVTADLTVTKCATVKSGAGASTCQNIKGITFEGSFIPEHTTAWTFPHDVANTKVVYNREFTPGQWATICVPFNMSAADAATVGEFYELVSFADGELGFNRVAEPRAYVPYLINPSAATPMTMLGNRSLRAYTTPEVTVDGVTFCGTMQYTDNLSKPGYDLYGYSAADGEFVQVGTNVSVKAFRAYIAIPTSAGVSPRLRVTTGTSVATGLDNVQTTEDPVYYNIMGQRVSRDTKGIVICNGKKFINM